MKGSKPYVVVIIIQTIYAAMFLLSKAAFNNGMNSFIFVFYRQAIGTLFITPFAFFFEWKTAPPLSFRIFCKIFLLSLFGITLSLDLNALGVVYTSATLGAAISNCLPAITFLLALLLGVESLKIKTAGGIAKVVGIIACLAGAAVLAFYKGPHFQLLGHHHHLLNYHQKQHNQDHSSWIEGCFILLLSSTLFGLWLVLQAIIIKDYPSKMLFTTLQCFLSSIQSLVIALAIEKGHFEQWKLGWNISLLTIIYCGIIVTGVSYYLQTWVIEKRGPVFLVMSTPLVLIFTIFFSAILLGEIITLGSLLGGFLLVVGLYSVLWGKSKEQMPKVSTLDMEQASAEVTTKCVKVIDS